MKIGFADPGNMSLTEAIYQVKSWEVDRETATQRET
jgi:hypothetical protein